MEPPISVAAPTSCFRSAGGSHPSKPRSNTWKGGSTRSSTPVSSPTGAPRGFLFSSQAWTLLPSMAPMRMALCGIRPSRQARVRSLPVPWKTSSAGCSSPMKAERSRLSTVWWRAQTKAGTPSNCCSHSHRRGALFRFRSARDSTSTQIETLGRGTARTCGSVESIRCPWSVDPPSSRPDRARVSGSLSTAEVQACEKSPRADLHRLTVRSQQTGAFAGEDRGGDHPSGASGSGGAVVVVSSSGQSLSGKSALGTAAGLPDTGSVPGW